MRSIPTFLVVISEYLLSKCYSNMGRRAVLGSGGRSALGRVVGLGQTLPRQSEYVYLEEERRS